MKKRVTALALAAVMALASMTGCSTSVDASATVAEVGEEKITLGLANFYARYQQAQYETYYASILGENMWSGDATSGYDYEEIVKEGVMESLQTLYVIRQHAEEYGVELTDAEKASIADAAKAFLDNNELKAVEAVTAEPEVVEELLTLFTYDDKMYSAMVADVDTEVSDEEAAQKSMQYVRFSFTSTDDEGNVTELSEDEIEALKAEAEAFATEAKSAEDFAAHAEGKGYTVSTTTFDAETTSPTEEVIAAANVMSEGQVSDVIITDNACYVVQLTSLLDREATDAEKVTIVTQRQEERYTTLCSEWLEAANAKVYDRVWNTVDFEKLGVTIKDTTEE